MSIYERDEHEAVAAEVLQRLGNRAGLMFRNAYFDTLDRTIRIGPRGAFVITGDIPAMWLRDSTAQLAPYLHVLDRDATMAATVSKIVQRQLWFITHDSYANAFNDEANSAGHRGDVVPMSPWTWERKYEVDSLCYPLQLSYDLWRITGRSDHLASFRSAAAVAIKTWLTECEHEALSAYRFQRFGGPLTDTLQRDGRGPRVAPIGLTWSGFRPSDDACELGYNIAGNAFAAIVLSYVAEIAREVFNDDDLAIQADSLSEQLRAALAQHGSTQIDGREVYAYEVDGFGDSIFMDDANVPSLLSLPLLGWCSTEDPVYMSTRFAALSPSNPFFTAGSVATGVGSPHTPTGWVWPIGIAVQGLTANSTVERDAAFDTLLRSDGGTGRMHESFDPDDPRRFTRPWFSWANAMFCELALEVAGLRGYRRAPLHPEVRA